MRRATVQLARIAHLRWGGLRPSTCSGGGSPSARFRASTAAFVVLSLGASSSPALAQARTVLVLPWSLAGGDAAAVAARAESVVGAISTGDVSPIAVADARTRFEEHGSAEPPTMSDSDLDHWLSLSRLAVRHLAHADYAAARQTLLEAQALSEPAAAELNREETRARQVLDTCLYEVRALVETEDPRADARTLECRRLVPRVAPSPYQHTPEVVELLTRVDGRLAAAPPGSLHLESVPTGCQVRLNGIAVGTTPYASEDLANGEYRAQVECTADGEPPSRRGRIHRIRLSEGASTVRIDTRFDSVVRTDTALRLEYASEADADAHRLDDALSAASTIGAAEVWLVSIDVAADDVVRIDRVSVAQAHPLASVRTHTMSGLPASVAALAHGTSQDRTLAAPISMPTWGTQDVDVDVEGDHGPSSSASARADWEYGVGITLGVLGVAGYVTSFVLVGAEQTYGHQATQPLVSDPDYLSRRRTWTSSEAPVLIVGALGGLFVTAALPFVMTDEDGTPWWSWVIGGVGVAAVATGLAIAFTAPSCGNDRPTDACVAGMALADDGALITALGAPLLSVPVVYLIRSVVGGSAPVMPSVSASATSASLSLGGTW